MKTIPTVVSLLITLALLAACASISQPTTLPETTVSSLPAHSSTLIPATNTPAPSSTPIPATSTPEPSPTPRPHYEINDPATWPQDMQDYWNQGNNQWENAALTAGFDTFILQTRRNYLAENGVADVETMSDQDIFYQYIRLGQEHRGEPLTLTPSELRMMNNNAMNRNSAQFAYWEGVNPRIVHDGIWVDQAASGIMQDSWYNRWFGPPQSPLRDSLDSVTLQVFGASQVEQLASFDGVIGDAASTFRLPGVDSTQAQGLLVHIFRDEGHSWLPLVVHFQDITLQPGDKIVNGMGEIVDVTTSLIIPASRSSFNRANHENDLTSELLRQLIGSKIHAGIDIATGAFGYFPYNLGLLGTNSDIRIINMDNAPGIYSGSPIWPWNTQP